MYGYEHIRPTLLETAQVTAGGLNLKQRTELAIKNRLCADGLYEAMHYSFFSPSDLDLLRFPEDAPERNAIRILNPINEELSIMRTTLAASMLHAIERNQKNGTISGRLFEVASRFVPKGLPLTEYPDEKQTLCVGIWGSKESFYTLKGIAQAVADCLLLEFSCVSAKKTFLHPYRTAELFCEGEKIGYLGELAYDIEAQLSLRTSAYIMEIDLSALEKFYGRKPVFRPLSKYPDEKRDLALVMDKGISCGQVEELIRLSCPKVSGINLFDIYEGAQIRPDKRSMAFTITFSPDEEELTDAAVDAFVKKILKNLKKELDIELRS